MYSFRKVFILKQYKQRVGVRNTSFLVNTNPFVFSYDNDGFIEFLLAGHTTSTIHINNSLSFLSPSPKRNIISDTSSFKKTTKSTPTSSSKKMKTNYDSTPISTTNAVLSLLMDSREFSDLTSFIDCTTTRDWSSSVLSCEIITFSLHTANHTQLTRLQMHS